MAGNVCGLTVVVVVVVVVGVVVVVVRLVVVGGGVVGAGAGVCGRKGGKVKLPMTVQPKHVGQTWQLLKQDGQNGHRLQGQLVLIAHGIGWPAGKPGNWDWVYGNLG